MADSYLAISAIANDQYMTQRMYACATQQQYLGTVNLGLPGVADPFSAQEWVNQNKYVWAASPSWGEKWKYALDSNPDDPDYEPGKDEAVITDGDILSTVQALAGPEPAAAE
jgi:hypothetical protein